MPDGTPKHLSALQKCYDYIADNGMDSFLTEHQNDPPADDADSARLGLTEYHIQQQRLSGLERRVVPGESILITRGMDVRKTELHYAAIAWTLQGAGYIIDYSTWRLGTEDMAAADCEVEILKGLRNWKAWSEENPYCKEGGEIVDVGLTLIDMGWKDEHWNSQPVQVFCAEAGREFLPSKGTPNYRRPSQSDRKVIGDHWHIEFPDPFVSMNADHWKLKVHEGFLLEPGQAGSLVLFNHPIVDGRAQRNYHVVYSKHILAEVWEPRIKPGFKHPETKWWHSGRPNHYFDATYAAFVARSVKGLNPVRQPGKVLAKPQAVQSVPATVKTSDEQVARQPAPSKPVPQVQQPRSVPQRRRVTFRR